LTDGHGNPIVGEDITFSTETEGASLGVLEVTTDSNGEGKASLTLSRKPGLNRVVASTGDLSNTVEIAGLRGPLAKIEVNAEPERTLRGESSTLTVQATDEYGNPIEDVEILFASKTSGASLSTESVKTGSGGKATAVLTTADRLGDNAVEVSAEGLPAASVKVHGGRLASIMVDPGGTELVSGSSQRFKALGFDETGIQIVIEPHWSVTGDIGTIGESGEFTGAAAGRGTVVATLRNITGTAEIMVTPGALSSITILPQEVDLASGETHQFKCEGRDAAGNEIALVPTWSLSRDFGAIDDEGVYTAKAAGEEKVIAAAEGFASEALVTVTASSLSAITIEPSEVQLEAGATQQFTVTGYDVAGNEVAIDPTWTVSKGIGEIGREGKGQLTAIKAGTGELVVVSKNIAARAKIKVTPGELSQIVVTPEVKDIASGTSFRFTSTGRDQYGNEVAVTPSWSVTGGMGKIDETGLFTGVTVGKGQVVAASGSVAGRARLEVVPGEVVKLEIAPERANVVAGSTQQFEITAFDAAGNTRSIRTEWNIVGGIGEVDPDGTFQAKVAGDGEIISSYEDVSAKAAVSVRPSELVTIAVSPDTQSLRSGSSQKFTAIGYDAYGNELSIKPRWTVTGGIGEIEPTTGRFTAVGVGQGTVVATVGSLGGRADIRVNPDTLATIEMSSQATVESGRTWQFQATGRDENGNPVPVSPSWTVTENVGEIDDTGLFTAASVGDGKVVARVGNITGTTGVAVEPGTLAALEISPRESSLRSGEKLRFSAVGKDSYGNEIGVEPIWKVDSDVGSINSDGVFTAKVAGSGKIVATSGPATDESRVTVTPGEVVSVLIAPDRVEVSVGQKKQFEATGLDEHGNEIDIEPQWSVTSGVGSINSKGRFEAAVRGEGRVLATYESIVGSADVTTIAGNLARLRILPAELTLESGGSRQFKAEGLDANDNAIDEVTVTWSTSGEIGTIGETTGLFTAVKAGTGEIVASSGLINTSAAIEVVPGEPSLDNSKVSVAPEMLPADGETAALVIVTVKDAFNNPVSGLAVTVTSSRADDMVQISELKTNENGIMKCLVSSNTPGQAVLTVNAAGATLADSIVVEFKKPSE
jgi:hypothetical protein